MRIYTKTGDLGETGLLGGARVSKASLRMDAHGDVEELNSWLGLCRTVPFDARIDALFERVQADLSDIAAEIAADGASSLEAKREASPAPKQDPSPRGGRPIPAPLAMDAVRRIERAIDDTDSELEPMKACIVPGGSPPGAHLHVARTVCRRAERKVVALAAVEAVRPEPLAYLNRLGDLLFVLARLANRRASFEEIPCSEPARPLERRNQRRNV